MPVADDCILYEIFYLICSIFRDVRRNFTTQRVRQMARQPNRFNAVAMDLLTGSGAIGTAAAAAGAGPMKKSSPLASAGRQSYT